MTNWRWYLSQVIILVSTVRYFFFLAYLALSIQIAKYKSRLVFPSASHRILKAVRGLMQDIAFKYFAALLVMV